MEPNENEPLEATGRDGQVLKSKVETISDRQMQALNALLVNIQIYGQPKYEDVAYRFEMRPVGLRTLLWKYRKGKLDLRGSELADKREINARDQLQITLYQLSEVEHLISHAIGQKLKTLLACKDDKDASIDGYRATGIMDNIEDLAKLSRLRAIREKSLLELLETLQRQKNMEKPADARVVESIPVPLSDSEKVARAFKSKSSEQ